MNSNEFLEAEPEAAAPVNSTGHRRYGGVAVALVLIIAIAIIFGMYSRLHARSALRETSSRAAVTPVNVVRPESRREDGELVLPGTTSPFTDTPIYARTSGYLKRWHVDIGTHVARGQLLAEIETPELDQQLSQAQAELKNSLANLNISRITADRWRTLLQSDSVSHQEADQALSDLQSKQAIVDSKVANVERLQRLVGFERIVAPVDGVITVRNTDIGALIQAGDNGAPKELFHLAATQTLRVYISVPETYASLMNSGDPVSVTFDAFPGKPYFGTVVRTANAIDITTRTLNVEVDIGNASGEIMPGAYAFVHFRVPTGPHAVTIPSNALLFRSEGLRVAVVRQSHVNLVPIEIGEDYGNTVQVIAGLTPADAVIVNPSDSLDEGADVQVEAAPNSEAKK